MKKVTIEVTPAQLRALLHLVGASADHPDVMASLFPDGRERKAAVGAADAVSAAYREAFGTHRR